MTEPYVRPARSADLDLFAAALDDDRFFDDRWLRLRKERGVLFFAWLGPRPAGSVYLWLVKAEEAPIQTHLPGVPLLMHLQVHPELRRLGVGTALVEEVEDHLVEHGHDRVALAVRTDNPAAAQLYDKLGYQDWGHGTVTCYAQVTLRNGGVLEVPERCYVLVKDLAVITPAQRTTSWIGASHR
ncbi:GNAT family N-acetyltransferase [Amycolatopsis sp. NPDC005961]|uniref:N-acetyltransferase domain-containing protein n=1 Tax=Amycolatopsis camponoti TaxID=2606593 RepID=A0A6I8LY43_9PSEU|nr:GNAT family N-acetyltransferase [Amycolatopsis camponoti]VVJ20545.1 Uncharacterised protein [Amycolatopsis camponoti]